MKKFYIPIFAAIFLLASFISQGQTYNSITSNPNHWTLDDPRFWGATLPADIINPAFSPPPNCTNCNINIFSDVVVVPFQGALAANGGVGTTSLVPGADDPSLNHITLTTSTIKVHGVTSLTINSWLTLVGSSITIGNDPTSAESITINDQVSIDAASSIVLANNLTVINAQNLSGKTNILGTFDEIGNPGFKAAGIFSTEPVGGSYTQTLEINGIGSVLQQYMAPDGSPFYTFNCSPEVPGAPHSCDFGLVYGPVVTGFDATFGTIFGQSTTLPVQLVQFLATKNDDGSVKVSWATAQEQNSDYYEVDRSGDQVSWTSIGNVKAQGFASTTTNYFLNDKSPLDGIGYYRLKMVDLDGKFVYSKTVTVTTDNSRLPLVIYSNPFSDQIRLKLNLSKAQNLTMTVSDMQGKTYLTQSYQAQSGDNFVNMVPPVSSSGMYILHIQGDTYNQTIKLEKQ
jgi:hypothetical protein